jgi:hypothetical protein
MNESMNITVLIGGRPYSLSVKTREEHLIRKTVKEINDKVNEFQLTYSQRDKQDCLSMTLLTYAVDELNELLDNALQHND